MIQNQPPAESQQPTFTFDDRHWRVRGLEKQLSCERLRVNLMVSRRDLVHVDTIDLYVARMRNLFIKEAALELYTEERAIKHDLGRVLLALEEQQAKLIQQGFAPLEPELPVMTDQQEREALELLRDPKLIERILDDYEACGLVGEETSKLVCYLACVSRHLPEPLGVLVQSSSAAGKTTLQDAVLRFMPPEDQVRLSSITAQSLYYMPRDRLKHKILAVAEEDGVAQASYASEAAAKRRPPVDRLCRQRRGNRPSANATQRSRRPRGHAAHHDRSDTPSGTSQPLPAGLGQ
jgi:DNA primase